MKDIFQKWVIESEVGESCVGLSTVLKAGGFIYSFPRVRTVGRPCSIGQGCENGAQNHCQCTFQAQVVRISVAQPSGDRAGQPSGFSVK